MYRHIVVGWNGSEGAQDAMALTRVLRFAGAVTAVTAVAVRLDEEGVLPARTRLSAAEDWLDEIDVTAPSVPGALSSLVADRGFDLVIVGSSRHGAEGVVHAGGVGRGLLERSPCAMAFPPRGFRRVRYRPRFIGVAFDGGHQLGAVREAVPLARALGARLRLFCIAPPLQPWARDVGSESGYRWSDVTDHRRRRSQALLEHALADTDPASTTGQLLEGRPLGELLARVGRGADLIVAGPPATGALQRTLAGIGAGAEGSAPCPILIAPARPVGDRAA